jgi:hypothetical protein
MRYLTYSEYQAMGGDLPVSDFTRHEYAAGKEIDRLTFDRLQDVSPIPQDLKMCVLELIQRQLCGDLNGQDYSSQGAGKISGTKEDRQQRIDEIVRRYLDSMTVDGIPVFFSGN